MTKDSGTTPLSRIMLRNNSAPQSIWDSVNMMDKVSLKIVFSIELGNIISGRFKMVNFSNRLLVLV